ncbi:Plasmodium exported protein, unknown function [Plasmodium vivax]|uniref:Variable surface protein n=1 Tax=Plasmodium vivax TaxID=5855 RepID=A0A565A6U5_PLAVI|nr:Plasmodium exported protein, unknown function [Plasmodium vivax]
MELLGNCKIKNRIKAVVLLKIFMYTFLIWNPINSSIGKFLEIKYEHDRLLNIRCSRLLAKHVLKNDSYKTQSRQKQSSNRFNKDIINEAENKSTYSQIKKSELNYLDLYRKDYKNRYSKKKGLSKLDCYYENKVFNKINNIFEISEYIKNNNKFYNKKAFNKYIIRLIIFSFIPFIGLIIPFFFSEYNPLIKNWCFSTCTYKHDGSGTKDEASKAVEIHRNKSRYLTSLSKDALETMQIVNFAFLLLSITIVLFVLLYILIKSIKYARLRAGKGKISLKQYCCFFKELITVKLYL